jgi:hypothetical protein
MENSASKFSEMVAAIRLARYVWTLLFWRIINVVAGMAKIPSKMITSIFSNFFIISPL